MHLVCETAFVYTVFVVVYRYRIIGGLVVLRKSTIALIVLVLIVGAWFASRTWTFVSDINGIAEDTAITQGHVQPEPTAEPGNEMEIVIDEQTQLREEQLEAERLEAEVAARREAVLDESRLLFRGYFYDEALALLRADDALINYETQSLETEILEALDGLVLFEGDIKHIFFSSLILDIEEFGLARSASADRSEDRFLYHSELLAILPQLLERGYVLYSITDIFSKDADGIMRQNDIYLPAGKTPLIISIDDPTFHYGQRFVNDEPDGTGGFDRTLAARTGYASRIVFDEYDELAVEVVTHDGSTFITRSGSAQLVIDEFVREHPEFSFRGSKGVFATTGFMGIFGYDTPYLRDEVTRQNIIDISNRFKERGWLFASHSYLHNSTGFWGNESSSDNIRWDASRWHEEIAPLVGAANIFVAPFGFLLGENGMQILSDSGFDIYCTMEYNQAVSMYDTHIVMGRLEISGRSIERHEDIINRDFFDIALLQ